MKTKNKKIRKNIDLEESVVCELLKMAEADGRTIKSFMERVLLNFVKESSGV